MLHRLMAHISSAQSQVIVRKSVEKNSISILIPAIEGIVKPRNFQRPLNEDISKCFWRLRTEINNNNSNKGTDASKKKKKKTPEDETISSTIKPMICVQLLSLQGHVVDETTSHDDAWISGHVLQIGDLHLSVLTDPPTVISLSVPKIIMEGVPVFPKFKLENATAAKWMWHVEHKNGPSVAVGTNEFYIPSAADVGAQIRVECCPVKGTDQFGETKSYTAESVVSAMPSLPVLEQRASLFAREPSSNSNVRVMSYNILHEGCSVGEFAETILYPHCSPELLTIDYRQNLLLKELVMADADIVCMQEVGSEHFANFWTRQLQLVGMQSSFRCKANCPQEGEAIAWKQDRFELRKEYSCDMQELLTEEYNEDVCDRAKLIPHVWEALNRSSVIVQVLDLWDKENDRQLLVANTHLFFHPGAPHIRNVHALFITRLLHRLQGERCGVVLCGDLNASMKCGVLHLLTGAELNENHDDWVIGDQFVWKQSRQLFWDNLVPNKEQTSGNDVVCSDIPMNLCAARESNENQPRFNPSIKCPITFNNAASHPDVPFTHVISAERRAVLLDHILYSENELQLLKVMPTVLDKQAASTALPSIAIPSDHLAVAAEFQWR